MSPEQARGKAVDKRTDIWAFGCVLYEMLTGRATFAGDTVADTLAAIVERDPVWTALPATIPSSIRQLLVRCVEKNPNRRLHDIADARIEIDDALNSTPSRVTRVIGARRRPWVPAIALVVVASASAIWVWNARDRGAPVASRPRVSRMFLTRPGTASLPITGSHSLAITRDGTRVVYIGNDWLQIFVRPLDQLEPTPIFTAATPLLWVSLSSDDEWLAFVEGNQLKKVALTGGPVTTIAVGIPSAGATWTSDGGIITGDAVPANGLQRVPAAGGPPAMLTRPAEAKGEGDHVWPEMLPGDRGVLFTITAVTGGLEAAQVAVLNLATGAYKVLVRGGSHAHYAATGHLLYAVAGTLRAVPFDLTTLETHGVPTTVLTGVQTSPQGAAAFVVADDGTLAYVASAAGAASATTLVWVDRQGKEQPLDAPPKAYLQPRLSPDGTKVAVAIADDGVWLWRLQQQTLTRLSDGFFPVWTRDGRRLVFSASQNGLYGIFSQSPDAAGAAETLATGPSAGMLASDVTKDGRHVLFSRAGRDVMMLTIGDSTRVEPLIQTTFNERNGVVSPDERWLAYESDSSDRFEIYVRPFPAVTGGQQWRISTAGGTRPLWSPTRPELFYVAPDGALMAVPLVINGTTWGARTPATIVRGPYLTGGSVSGRTYDVSSDGTRLLLIKRPFEEQVAPQIVVVQNFLEQLKRSPQSADPR